MHPFLFGIKMKLICFTNMYISAIQNGIQSTHSLGELVIKYQSDSLERTILWDWLTKFKTVVILNAGSSLEMKKARDLCKNTEGLVWASFREPWLDDALTSVVYIETDALARQKEYLSMIKATDYEADTPLSQLLQFSLSKPIAR